MENITQCEVECNRHHLLYPRRVWAEAGKDARYIRGVFVVNMPIELHNELHQEIDKNIGDSVMAYHLPSKHELARIAKLVHKNERYIAEMSPMRKLLWLWAVIPANKKSEYMQALIAQEILFFRTRKGEY